MISSLWRNGRKSAIESKESKDHGLEENSLVATQVKKDHCKHVGIYNFKFFYMDTHLRFLWYFIDYSFSDTDKK